MRFHLVAFSVFTLAVSSIPLAGTAFAVVSESPPPGSAKLSAILTSVEARPDFSFVNSVDYGSGRYQIVYYMSDGAEVRMEFDAMSGEPIKPEPAVATNP